jgi:hypothetical protein
MSFGPSFTFDENSYWQIFEDWNANPDIANTAQELYGDIDRLERTSGRNSTVYDEDDPTRLVDRCR